MQVHLIRDGIEFEIEVVTIEEGSGHWDHWQDTGWTWETDSNPTFAVAAVYDDNGDPVTLTEEEIAAVKEKAVDRYWETYNDN